MVPENTHTHLEEGHWKFQGGGRGGSEAKIFKGKYEANVEILEGWGVQTKNNSVGGVWIFSGTTQLTALNSPWVHFVLPYYQVSVCIVIQTSTHKKEHYQLNIKVFTGY